MQVVGDCFGVGIDDTHIKIRGAPVLDEASLDAHQKMIADKLQVRAREGSRVAPYTRRWLAVARQPFWAR